MTQLGASDTTKRQRHIVILAGKKSHGPQGNGIHDYPAQARLFHDCLMRSALADQLTITRLEDDDWQSDVIDTADCLVIISDGRDGNLPYDNASHQSSPQRIEQMDALVKRGMGVVPVHFATFSCEADMAQAIAWQGAVFHWEQNGQRKWYSKITWAKSIFERMQSAHPVLNGVDCSRLREEFYHKLAFAPNVTPLIHIRALPMDDGDESQQTVAWCLEREDGGRGFGTTMGHSLDIFRHDGLRTMMLNGIAWAAGLEIPDEGLNVSFADREVVNHRLGIGPEVKPIRVAMLSGNNAHRWHNWPETTGALLRAYGDDDRIVTTVYTDPESLIDGLNHADVLVLNWCNWEDPIGLSEQAKAAIEAFTKRGGGVFIHHFSNGACHASLPRTDGQSDWPWYRTLVRRVWDHRDIAPGRSGHDKFGKFTVNNKARQHPITALLPDFEVEDELYWRQHGDEPIEPLMVAHSNVTGADEPMVWCYEVNDARVVQSLLGHSAATYNAAPARALVRRAIAWCARREIHGHVDDGVIS